MQITDRITQVPGIGPAYESKLEKLDIYKVSDLLYHKPLRYIDYSVISPIGQIQEGETVTIRGKVKTITSNFIRGRRLSIQRALISDDSGEIQLTFFNQPFLVNMFTGNMVGISGTVKRFGNKLTFDQPEYEVLRSQNGIHTGRIVCVYPQTEGVSSKWLRVKIALVLNNLIDFDDPVPAKVIEDNNLLTLKKAVNNLHHPESLADIEDARKRLAFDELFYLQLASVIRKKSWQEKRTKNILQVDEFNLEISLFIKNLPFELTPDQERVIDEILKDLRGDIPMNRLVSGDVGSGKTVVSAVALYLASLNKTRALFMVPTEILANQHYKTLKGLFSKHNIRIGLSTSTKKTEEDFDILIGTHALLHQKNLPSNISLIVIDEQHRFGVEQRSLLSLRLASPPHILTMTATPIPRTIALTMYGELDVSTISKMPKGRKRIKTFVVEKNRHSKGYEWIAKQILAAKKSVDAQQAFIVYPLIEESEKLAEVKAATSEYQKLTKGPFKNLNVGLLHGKLKPSQKEKIMKSFRDKKLDILISTTVIEVGMDIPNATIMVIEHAERFGLASLHQLRGRVGRNDKESWCFLFSDMKSERLKAMETNYSGIALAEIDLKIRGGGNIFGVKQHGSSELKFANFTDSKILTMARKEAEEFLASNKNSASNKEIKNRLSKLLDGKILPN